MVVLCQSCGKPVPEDWGILADDGTVWHEECFNDDYEPLICWACNGSGEGRWGGRCIYCKGGMIYPEPDPEDDPRHDDEERMEEARRKMRQL